jgi:hypothetical protein
MNRVLVFLLLVGCGDDFSFHDGGPKEIVEVGEDAMGDGPVVSDDSGGDAVDGNSGIDAAKDAATKDAPNPADADAGAPMCLPKYLPDASTVPWCKDNNNMMLGTCCPGSSCACEYQPTHYFWCC